ncbi:MAG: FecR domain-containing protein [Sphingomonadaceae bacterium]|nr:FecR domain-containing protein [Sphingomonadaceae bacterium]
MRTIGISSIFRLAVVLFAVLLAASALRAETGDADTIQYRVKRGDTLIELAERYFVRPATYRQVQKENNIADPRRLPVGKVIEIPVELLRARTARLVVSSFTGPVELRNGGSATAPAKDTPIAEGTEIVTGRNGFISLSGDGGSIVTLPSNSHVRVLKTRRYLINDGLDVDFLVLDGRGGFKPHKLDPVDRYRVRTPLAVTAVRGTEFRIFYSEDSGKSGTQVDEGTVELAAKADGADARAVPAGFAAIATSDGLSANEALLPAVAITDPSRVRTEEEPGFALKPVAGAIAYRTQLAADAAFIEVIAEKLTEQPEASFQDIPNGRLYVRSRAVAESGVEGWAEAYSFRRQRLGVAAVVEQDELSNGFRFAWRQEGEGHALFGFRLWREGAEDRPLVHERAMQDTSLVLSNLDNGTYYWSVGALQGSDDGIVEVWGDPQKLNVSN